MNSKTYQIFNSDSFETLSNIGSDTIDCVITDPPYFLSNDGITCMSGKMVSVNKGNWDKSNGFSDVYDFNLNWIKECYRIMKMGGTMWISGTFHNIYIIGSIIQSFEDFKILNNITWIKKSPPPNLSCRFFTHSTETILWIRKGVKSKHYFDYDLMKKLNQNKQMKDVWIIGRPKKDECKFGKHPTQKPEEIIERMVLSSTKENDTILDLFSGSGTTGIVTIKNKRKFIGIEKDEKYFEIMKKRLEE
jgi:site-specific DNA-methyltransferase (adenine-specific)